MINEQNSKLKARVQEPVERSKTRRIVEVVTSHVKFQSPKIKKKREIALSKGDSVSITDFVTKLLFFVKKNSHFFQKNPCFLKLKLTLAMAV